MVFDLLNYNQQEVRSDKARDGVGARRKKEVVREIC